MKFSFLIVLTLLTHSPVLYSQSDRKPIHWIVRPSFGMNLPVTKLSGGYITDNLVGYASNTFYWQVISTSYFFSNWGIEFSFAGNHRLDRAGRYTLFIDEVEDKYAANYYVTLNSGAKYSDFNVVGGTIEKGCLGPVYKFEKDRMVIIGRAMIGVTSFDRDWGSAELKGKGTNELIRIKWSSDRVPQDFFTLNRLSDRIVMDLDVNYWMYPVYFDYIETIENMNTKEIESQTYSYANLIHEVSIGIGFMIVLK